MMIIGNGGYAGAHHARLAWTTRASVQEKDKRIKLQRFARIAKLSLTRSRPPAFYGETKAILVAGG